MATVVGVTPALLNPVEAIPQALINASAPGATDAPPSRDAVAVAPDGTSPGLSTTGQSMNVFPDGIIVRPPTFPQQLDFHSEYSISAILRHSQFNAIYDKQLRMGNHVFVSNDQPMNDPEGRITLNVAQLNEILRVQYQKFMDLVNLPGAISKVDKRIDTAVIALAKQIYEEGEHAYHHIPDLQESIRKKVTYEVLGYWFMPFILDKWRYAGVIEKNEIQYPYPSSRTMTLCVGGVTKTHPENLWGKVYKGQHLFFVLRRHFDAVRGQYTYYEFTTQVSDDHYIPFSQMHYRDSAGYDTHGHWIFIGSVRDDPPFYPAPEVCKILQGVSGSATEAFAYRRSEDLSLDITLMTSKMLHCSFGNRFG